MIMIVKTPRKVRHVYMYVTLFLWKRTRVRDLGSEDWMDVPGTA